VRVLVIDPDGSNGLDIALRAQQWGHDVKLAIRAERRQGVGKGLVPKVDDPRDWFRWSNLIICTDNSVYLDAIASHRRDGGLATAATPETSRWEIDRSIGHRVLKKAGEK
jgi:hypothetical protein